MHHHFTQIYLLKNPKTIYIVHSKQHNIYLSSVYVYPTLKTLMHPVNNKQYYVDSINLISGTLISVYCPMSRYFSGKVSPHVIRQMLCPNISCIPHLDSALLWGVERADIYIANPEYDNIVTEPLDIL